jgi:allophanate hydrolase subunit 2
MPGDVLPIGDETWIPSSDRFLLKGSDPLSHIGQLSTDYAKRKPHFKKLPESLIPEYKHEQTIRIISGPEAHYFEMTGLRSFLSTEYTVTAQSDRIGYRLSGEPIKHKEGMTNIISAGISLGTVQIPGDGQPIILMADRQTTGGYARIANVITVDLTLLAQMRPGDTIHFREATLDHGHQLYIDRRAVLYRS